MTRTRTLPRWETPDPPGVTGTYGDKALRWAKRELGITPSFWQAYAIRKILRHDRRGDLLARIALVSTARQNGKSVIVRIIVGWFLDEGQFLEPFRGWSAILAAAHDSRQARIMYRGVYADIEGNERLRAATRTSIYRGIERERIIFDVVTNQPGSARGWSAGLIPWDEMLTQRDWDMWEALSPTQSAQRSPLMVLTSTAGHAQSVVLRAFYDRLRRQASGDEKPDPAFYGAWWQSLSDGAGLDWEEIQRANPALGDGRLTRRAIASEHAIIPADSWRRERLNHWVDAVAPGAFAPGVWARCRQANPLEGVDGPFALGVDIHPGWERATIAVAGIRPDNRVGVEIYRDMRAREGVPITAEVILDQIRAFPEPIAVIAYDAISGAAGAFMRDEAESGLPWDGLKSGQVIAASMDVAEMIQSGRLAAGDPLLDVQIAFAARRPVGQEGAFRFSRQSSLGPIDAVMAMTLAAHGIVFREAIPDIR